MLRIVPHTVPRVGRSYEHFPDGFELHLLHPLGRFCLNVVGVARDAGHTPMGPLYVETLTAAVDAGELDLASQAPSCLLLLLYYSRSRVE